MLFLVGGVKADVLGLGLDGIEKQTASLLPPM